MGALPAKPHQGAPSGRERHHLRKTPRRFFKWRGLGLHYLNRRKPTLTLVQDEQFPRLYRITYPDGWQSTPANLTRCKDASYGHARKLLAELEEVAHGDQA